MHTLSSWIHPLAVFDGNPSSDVTTSDQPAWIPITVNQYTPHILFIAHGLVGATSDTTVNWKIMGATCDSPSVFAEYTAITNASGTVTPADSVTTYGPFMIDVNCRGYTGVAFYAYSCDAVPVEMHVIALGYGGARPAQTASDYICV